MDFITGFPKTQKGNDAIFVVVDKLSKVAHFLPVHESITASQLADLYVSRILSLHGVPLEINSDRGSLFTSRFWESFQNAMGTHLSFSTAYHPQSSGQVERVNQILKTCSDLVLSLSERNGRILFLLPNLRITIASSLVWAWLLLNFSMDRNVEHP